MRIDVGMMLHSNVPMYEIPIGRSSPLWVHRYVRTPYGICKFKRQAVFGTIILSYFECIDPKNLHISRAHR